jgi:hypothetical protein
MSSFRGETKRHTANMARGTVGAARRGLEANAIDPRVRGAVRRTSRLQAFCVCGARMMNTTADDIKAGIQPRCGRCPKEDNR